jgi:hypothetical protein
MEEYVKDCLLTNEFTDLVLLRLVELTIASDQEGRPLFSNLLSEPVFFRKHFRLWVSEALEEKKALDQQADPFSEGNGV